MKVKEIMSVEVISLSPEDNAKDALNLASSMAKKDSIILVTGSLYLVGDAYSILKGKA